MIDRETSTSCLCWTGTQHPVECQIGGYGVCIPLEADLHMFEQQSPLMAAPSMYDGPLCQKQIMQQGHLRIQVGVTHPVASPPSHLVHSFNSAVCIWYGINMFR